MKKDGLFFPILTFSLNIIGAIITFGAPTSKIQAIGLLLIFIANLINIIYKRNNKI